MGANSRVSGSPLSRSCAPPLGSSKDPEGDRTSCVISIQLCVCVCIPSVLIKLLCTEEEDDLDLDWNLLLPAPSLFTDHLELSTF
jgi:hypothetical protein